MKDYSSQWKTESIIAWYKLMALKLQFGEGNTETEKMCWSISARNGKRGANSSEKTNIWNGRIQDVIRPEGR